MHRRLGALATSLSLWVTYISAQAPQGEGLQDDVDGVLMDAGPMAGFAGLPATMIGLTV
jgi:hypothetical protein